VGGFDKAKFAGWLERNALPPFGAGYCAKYVRLALQEGGCDTVGHPELAKDWGPTLLRIGFSSVQFVGYTPEIGDVIVIQASSKEKAGHIEGYDGQHWISDFVQREMWPGPRFRIEAPHYDIYRFGTDSARPQAQDHSR